MRAKNFANCITRLEARGFTYLGGYESVWNNKAQITVSNPRCGHTFTAQANNIINGATECGICGPQKRMQKALAAYMEKYARDYDVALWKDYMMAARMEAERTYRAHKSTINPRDLPRGRGLHHLDHKVPIIEGFKRGVPVELISGVANLQMLPEAENHRKNAALLEEHADVLTSLTEDYDEPLVV